MTAATKPIQNPATLGDVNHILSKIGLPKITARQLTHVVATSSKDVVLKALRVIQHKDDPGARAFLQRALYSTPPTEEQTVPSKPSDTAATGKTTQTKPPTIPKQGEKMKDTTQEFTPPNVFDTPISTHVYGRQAALCFEADKTKRDFHTMSIDAATSTGPKQYNWVNKVKIQMTKEELPVALAVLLGILPGCEYKNHGEANNKGFSIVDQGESFFVRVFSPEGVKAVPMTPEDAFRVAAAMLKQLHKNHAELSTGDLITLIRVIIGKKGKGTKT